MVDPEESQDLFIYPAPHNAKLELSIKVNSGIQTTGGPDLSSPVPEPSLGLLLGISLIGLVGAGTVRKIKQNKEVANS